MINPHPTIPILGEATIYIVSEYALTVLLTPRGAALLGAIPAAAGVPSTHPAADGLAILMQENMHWSEVELADYGGEITDHTDEKQMDILSYLESLDEQERVARSCDDTDRFFSAVASGDGVFVALTQEGRGVAVGSVPSGSPISDTEAVRNMLGDLFYFLEYRSQ